MNQSYKLFTFTSFSLLHFLNLSYSFLKIMIHIILPLLIWRNSVGLDFLDLRAFIADVSNMPNVKYLTHLAHQTQKRSFIRCVKYVKFLQHVTVPLHFWHGTNLNDICTLLLFFHLSLSSHSEPLHLHFSRSCSLSSLFV